jgi:hypothetical protein
MSSRNRESARPDRTTTVAAVRMTNVTTPGDNLRDFCADRSTVAGIAGVSGRTACMATKTKSAAMLSLPEALFQRDYWSGITTPLGV